MLLECEAEDWVDKAAAEDLAGTLLQDSCKVEDDCWVMAAFPTVSNASLLDIHIAAACIVKHKDNIHVIEFPKCKFNMHK